MLWHQKTKAHDFTTLGGVGLRAGRDRRLELVRLADGGLVWSKQILWFNGENVSAHAVEDGKKLWSYPWKEGHPYVCMPVAIGGDRVLISSGYGTGAHLAQLSRASDGAFAVKALWRSRHLKAKFANVVICDGFVYGLDDGRLACVDLATGRRRWKRGHYGHGQVILVGKLLLVTTETGKVVLIDPVPNEHRELTRFRALEGKT